MKIIKRNGAEETFRIEKIVVAITKANNAAEEAERLTPLQIDRIAQAVEIRCGAGFPGVPLKLGEPSLDLTLLDSLGKRVTWLEATLRDMGVPAQCVCSRAEDYAAKAREQYDIATSRAVARLNILAELCLPFVKPGGYFLAMKAAAAAEELEEAKRGIARLGGRVEKTETYDIDGAPRCVIVIRKERPTPPAYPRRYAKIKQSPL